MLLASTGCAAQTYDALALYRPWVRWWWNGDKVEKQELVRELHVLKDAGIGGVEINPIEFPAKRCDDLGIPSLVWLSDEWLDALEVTLTEAKRLGMGCDLLVGSGWPFGTETLPMEDRAQTLLVYAQPIKAGETFSITKDSIIRLLDPKVTVPNDEREGRLVALYLAPDTIADLSQLRPLPIPEGDTIVVNSGANEANGVVAPHLSDHRSQITGHYFLYALVRYESFASVINGAPGAAGPILDHMNAGAVQRYLDHTSRTLERRLGPMKNWLRAYFVDSMELEGSNWTGDFAEQFRLRRGYDVTPYLPLILFQVGRLGEPVSYRYGAERTHDFEQQVQQVRHDFELTKAELLHERYTQTFLDWCHKQGVKARAQAYGRGFFPLESSLGYDIPEGESWTTNYLRHRVGYEMPDDDYRRGRAYTMINKYVSSAAHLAGGLFSATLSKRSTGPLLHLVSAEEMTNTYMLFNTPLELLKLGSDMNAITGITHSVWHGFNYSPREAGFPGWVQYGSYLNEKNTWWPYFHLLNEYRARMSALLQNADMQTDIAIVPPTDQLWAECGVQTEPFPNYPKGSIYEATQLLWEAVHKNGGNCDLVPAAMADTARIVRGAYRCGCKAYRVLLLPLPDGITLRRPHKPDILLPLPDSNHYLEWYAQVQQQYQLPHAVSIDKPDRFFLQSHYTMVNSEVVNSELTNDGSRPQVTDHNSPKMAPAQFSILNSQFSIKNDLFLFLNAHIDRPQQHTVTFPRHIYRHRAAWLYDCNTGERSPLYIDKEGRLSLSFAQSEMKVVIFNNEDLPAYRQFLRRERRLRKLNRNQAFDIWPIVEPEHWQMHLHHAVEGWDTVVVTDTLCDLRSTDFRDFAGTITYTTAVTLDSSLVNSPLPHLLLFTTDDIAEVSVNGRHCATIWHGERQCPIPSQYLRAGDNTIEIKITTLLNNYVHTLTDDKVIQHFVLKRNIPTCPSGLRGQVLLY